jgi:hypothetical protein
VPPCLCVESEVQGVRRLLRVITRGVKVATVYLSLFLGVVLSLFVSLNEIKQASRTGRGWSYFAPGWKILDPGAHDAPVMILATLLDAGLYSLIVFAVCYGFVMLVDKVTQ